jgi:dTDP-glucose 4,6-dehydratase
MRNPDKVVVTGGAGFVGSHIVKGLLQRYPDSKITVLDKMTYAADYRNLHGVLMEGRVELVVGDVTDSELCLSLLEGTDLVIHAAAESHVDRSFTNSPLFTRTNVVGSHTVVDAARIQKVPRIIHISTDEVYGTTENARNESSPLAPTNPYSATKAAADMIVLAYMRSFQLPISVVRANNIFGVAQFPEKLIPRACMALIAGDKVPIHGTGRNQRHYLAVQDFVDALLLISEDGDAGQIYNVASEEEYTNLEVVRMIARMFDLELEEAIQRVSDRCFNDRRYEISCKPLSALGWRPQRRLVAELPGIVAWYRANAARYASKFRDSDVRFTTGWH